MEKSEGSLHQIHLKEKSPKRFIKMSAIQINKKSNKQNPDLCISIWVQFK